MSRLTGTGTGSEAVVAAPEAVVARPAAVVPALVRVHRLLARVRDAGIADPEFAIKAKEGRLGEIRRCIACTRL